MSDLHALKPPPYPYADLDNEDRRERYPGLSDAQWANRLDRQARRYHSNPATVHHHILLGLLTTAEWVARNFRGYTDQNDDVHQRIADTAGALRLLCGMVECDFEDIPLTGETYGDDLREIARWSDWLYALPDPEPTVKATEEQADAPAVVEGGAS